MGGYRSIRRSGINRPWLAIAAALSLAAAGCAGAASPSITAPASVAAPASSAPAASAAASTGASSAPAASAEASAAAPTGTPVTMAELFPMTGKISFVGDALVHGGKVGMYEINQAGGILGHPLAASLQDDAGDTVDAVPAWHALTLQNPAFMLGPTVFTAGAVIKLFDPSKLVDFLVAGATTYDTMNYQYVFRVTVSDATMAKGMAAYAIAKGYKHAALIFDSGANSQTIAAPLIAAYTAHGGTVVANQSIAPDQSSYRTEIQQVFASHPDAIFWQSDEQTAGTLFHDMEQLGDLNVPIIGTDNGASDTIAKAMGMSYATKYLTGMAGTPPTGEAWTHYVSDYKAVYNTDQPLDLANNMYDAIVVAALAMTDANSTDPSVWVNKITDVSNPPGTQCFTYASCLALLKAGQKVNYDGAGGPLDFNQYHNVYAGWDVVQFDASGKLNSLYTVAPDVLAGY
jgi:branched-chain amino acid transport system substrate-binding protein